MATALVETCVVCLGNYEKGEQTKNLPCGHLFHAGCIDQWLRRKSVCPICRMDVDRHHLAQETLQRRPETPQEFLDSHHNWDDADDIDVNVMYSGLRSLNWLPDGLSMFAAWDETSESDSNQTTNTDSDASTEHSEPSGSDSRIDLSTDSASDSDSSNGVSSSDSSRDGEVDSPEDSSSSSGSYSSSVPYRYDESESDDSDSTSDVSRPNSDESDSDSGGSDFYNSASYSLGSSPSSVESYSFRYSFGYRDSDLESD